MRYHPAMFAFLTAQIIHAPVHAATKTDALKDQEVIRMLEFLQAMEMIKQVDLLKDLHALPATTTEQKLTRPQMPESTEKKAARK